MMRRAVCFLLLALCAVEARVDFNHSVILDEFDFKDQSAITIYGVCSDTCHIYASITPESKTLAGNLLIQSPKGFVSIADVAGMINATDSRKSFLEISNSPALTIVNSNYLKTAGPVVLYIVNKAAAYFANTEVYEADGFFRPVSTLLPSLTVMSARPFTLTQAHLEGNIQGAPEGVLAQMAGFDALGYLSDPCPYLYYLIYGPFPGFTMEVNGPIISLLYDLNQFHFPPGNLSATIGISNKRQLERAGWIGSPGFHGCLGKEVYRSSLYDLSSPFHGEVYYDDAQDMSVDVITNTDSEHAVVLTDEVSGEQHEISNTPDKTPVTYKFHTNKFTVNWQPKTSTDEEYAPPTHFLVRYNSTLVPK